MKRLPVPPLGLAVGAGASAALLTHSPNFGISELLRIATLAEAYHVPISPHNAVGPLQVLAGAHAVITVPNLYRLEHNVANYNTFVDHPLDFRGDQLYLSERPGLGVDLDVELLEAKTVYRRPGT